jgi:peptide/nickel transport system substrate-binding protein
MMSKLTRREYLQQAAAATAALGGSSVLAACGGTSSKSNSPSAGPVRQGGTLRVGLTGGSSADTWDPHFLVNATDFARCNAVFEGLVGTNQSGKIVPVLAEEFTPNTDATEWTVRLRKGVHWHNGKELTADDVIFSFQRILNPKKPGTASSNITLVNAPAQRKLDKYTVRIPCHAPFATFNQVLAGGPIMGQVNNGIVPVGFDPKHPIGTGPFKAVSMTPNQQFVVARNADYWGSGLPSRVPYVDKIVYTEYQDESSQVNALLAGQADLIDLLSIDSARALQSAGQKVLINTKARGYNPMFVRVNVPPFNDVRVRQAMRLVVNRPQMINVVFGGHAVVANDIFGYYAAEYDHSLPQRVQDIEQAKSLLKQAGHEGLHVQMTIAPVAQGVVKAAQVYAQQASAAGINVTLRQVTVTELYGPNFTKWPCSVDYWLYNSYLPTVGLAMIPGAFFNETSWNNPTYNKLYGQALAEVDVSKRADICHEMQTIEYNSAGNIIPYWAPVIDGYSSHVQGLTPTISGQALHDYNLSSVWLSK